MKIFLQILVLSKFEILELSLSVWTFLDILASLCVQASDTNNQPCLEMIGNKLKDKPYGYSDNHYLFKLTQLTQLAAINT